MDIKKARIFASDIDETTKNQFFECIKHNYVKDAALMPDAHLGYVAPIGSVIVTKSVIVPAWVGYDIGCGVTAIELGKKDLLQKIIKNQANIFKKVKTIVPMGLGKVSSEKSISENSKGKLKNLLSSLEKEKINPEILSFIKRKSLSNLGSIGHGNHFAELSTDKKSVWLIIHSGSRNIGHKVATYYMKEAQKSHKVDNNNQFEATYSINANSVLGKEYLTVLNFLLEFALLNRIEISNKIVNIIEEITKTKLEPKIWANKNHNHAKKYGKNSYIHRKGATPSELNERGIIPANMRDGVFLVLGKGNKKFIKSSSHGAGRKMSKTKAKETISINEFIKTMKGITASVVIETIDESPNAYKDVFSVLQNEKESIKIIKQLKPIINWKGY